VLDLVSILVADFAVTLVIGILLLFASVDSSAGQALRWWGVAHLVLCGGVAMLSIAQAAHHEPLQNIAITLILLGYSLMWHAARVFERRKPLPMLVAFGTVLWLMLSISGVIAPPESIGFSLYSLLIASYCLATAYEFWSGRDEPLLSRWPAIVLQTFTGLGFLSWVMVALVFAVESLPAPHTSKLFSWMVLVTLLVRVAMAFVILAMAKERLELTQRIAASTDTLTGLPNRRGFFRRTIRHLRDGSGSPQWAAVLLFDLDHFKSINDRFGHAVGDSVLQIFAYWARHHLSPADYMGRIGGEEFAAYLPGADVARAAAVAEQIRESFAQATELIEGERVRATVSIGGVAMDCSGWTLDALLARADVALYSAKSAGRNCVKILGMTRHPSSDAAAHAAGGQPSTTSPPLTPASSSGSSDLAPIRG